MTINNAAAADKKFYIIETTYVGPDQDTDKYVDVDTIEISTAPAVGNLDGEAVITGWCGETNGWSVAAHGEFDTLAAARAAVAEIFDEVRDADPDGNPFPADGAVEVYKRGHLAPMGREATSHWCYAGICEDIAADTTDNRIAELVQEYRSTAASDGYALDTDCIESDMRARRQELRDEGREPLIDAIERARLDADEDVDDRYGALDGRRGISARRHIDEDGAVEWTVALCVDYTCTVLDEDLDVTAMSDVELAEWIEEAWDEDWDEGEGAEAAAAKRTAAQLEAVEREPRISDDPAACTIAEIRGMARSCSLAVAEDPEGQARFRFFELSDAAAAAQGYDYHAGTGVAQIDGEVEAMRFAEDYYADIRRRAIRADAR